MGVLEMLFGSPAAPAPPQLRVEEVRPQLTDLLRPRPERIYLPIRRASRAWALEQPGVKADPATGDVYIEAGKGAASSLEPYLPVAYRPGQPGIEVNLIPQSSWGANLSKLLSWPSWSGLRQPVIQAWGGRCCVCGCNERLPDPNGGRSSRKPGVDCHEIWRYDETAQIQKLVDLVSVCEACHDCFHPARAGAHGRGAETTERLVGICGWKLNEAPEALKQIEEDYKRRSRMSWTLDLALVAGHDLQFMDDRGELVRVIGANVRPGPERPRLGPDRRVFVDVPSWGEDDPLVQAMVGAGQLLPPDTSLSRRDPNRRYALRVPPGGSLEYRIPTEWAPPWLLRASLPSRDGLWVTGELELLPAPSLSMQDAVQRLGGPGRDPSSPGIWR